MAELILNEIVKQRFAIAFNVIAVLLFCAIYWVMTREFSWSKNKMKYFSYLYHLRTREVLSIGLIIGRFIFVVSGAVFASNLNLGYLAVFLIYNITILALTKNFKIFVSDCINYTIIFFLTYIENLLIEFYRVMDSSPYIIVMVVFMVLFVTLDALLQAINSYDRVIKWDL